MYIKRFIFVSLLLLTIAVTGCTKKSADIMETNAIESEPIWTKDEGETRSYDVISNEYSDYLNENEDDWIDNGKLIAGYEKFGQDLTGPQYRAAMLMPESVAEKISSHELLEFCMSHQAVADFTLFNTWQEGFDNVINVVNGFDYLFEKEDFAQSVYDEYMSREVSDEKNGVSAIGKDAILEIILAQDVVYSGLTDEQRENVIAKTDEMKEYRTENNIRIYDSVSMFGAAKSVNSLWDK